MNQDQIIKIYSGTMWEANMVKSLLDAAKIDSFLKNTVINSYAFNPISSDGVQVMISDTDLEKAQEIVNDYINSK